MSHEYHFVAHHIFDYHYEQVVSGNKDLEKSYKKQIGLIKSDPFIGRSMQYVPAPLQGRIFKKKIGGRKGYSLCYIILQDFKVALGVYITPESRDKVDYVNFPWHLFTEALEDFKNQDKSKLRIED